MNDDMSLVSTRLDLVFSFSALKHFEKVVNRCKPDWQDQMKLKLLANCLFGRQCSANSRFCNQQKSYHLSSRVKKIHHPQAMSCEFLHRIFSLIIPPSFVQVDSKQNYVSSASTNTNQPAKYSRRTCSKSIKDLQSSWVLDKLLRRLVCLPFNWIFWIWYQP